MREAWAVADELGWAKTSDAEYGALARIMGCRLFTVDDRLRRGAGRLIEIRPDLALVDLGLPGFDGLEVASRVRAATGGEPMLVALTGYGQPLDCQRTRRAGFDAHLLKPVSGESLSSVLAAAGARTAGRARAPIVD